MKALKIIYSHLFFTVIARQEQNMSVKCFELFVSTTVWG